MAKVSPFWTGTSYQHPLSTQPHPHGKTVLNTPDDVEHEEIFITNDQGLRLCIQRWRRKDHESRPVVGCIVCLHGLNTHAGYTFASFPDYSYHGSLIQSFVERGFAVYCPDHQGHGKSQRIPRTAGNVKCFDDIAHDQHNILYDVVRRDYPKIDQQCVPAFLLGHCMGGAHVLRTLQLHPELFDSKSSSKQNASSKESKSDNTLTSADTLIESMRYQYAGVIITAPSWRLAEASKPSQCLLDCLRFLACCLPRVIVADWPDAPKKNTKWEDYPASEKRFHADPWCSPEPFSAHYAHQLNCLYAALENSGTAIWCPILLLQGNIDHYVPTTDTDLLWSQIKSSCDSTYVTLQQMAHNLMYDPGWETVAILIGEWMLARLNPHEYVIHSDLARKLEKAGTLDVITKGGYFVLCPPGAVQTMSTNESSDTKNEVVAI